MDGARILAYITGTVDQELLLRNEYLVAENRILKAQLKTSLRLTDVERLHPCTYVCPCGYRLFLCGGTDAAWVGHLLRAVLYPFREPSR